VVDEPTAAAEVGEKSGLCGEGSRIESPATMDELLQQ